MNMNEVIQNEFLNRYIEQNSNMVEFITKVNSSLEQINDNNVLHRQSLEKNTEVTKDIATAFTASLKQENANSKFWKVITFLLVVSIIILAGVKQANELLKLVQFP